MLAFFFNVFKLNGGVTKKSANLLTRKIRYKLLQVTTSPFSTVAVVVTEVCVSVTIRSPPATAAPRRLLIDALFTAQLVRMRHKGAAIVGGGCETVDSLGRGTGCVRRGMVDGCSGTIALLVFVAGITCGVCCRRGAAIFLQ